jgi:HK97 family phage portal protein
MAIVRSFGALKTLAVAQPSWQLTANGGSWGGYAHSYATIYRTQPNVRTVVDFLARNVAQLGLHAFKRVSDTDRQRLAGHAVVRWVERPNPATTRYRLFESLMQDLGIYFNAFWLKVRESDRSIGLVRLPPEQMTVKGGLFPTSFEWQSGRGEPKEFAPTEIVQFGGYDPLNPLTGLSPIETLRRILSEEIAAQQYRANFFRNSARTQSYIKRPKEAGKWDATQRGEFYRQWNTGFAGGKNAGKTPVLQEGMELVGMDHSAKDSELNASRKLTREECAAAYHVPLPMVGILDHATFSNVKEQHKHLYADTLGPWCEMIVEELERQLLPEADDTENVYLEFNIAEKLKGSFEEQTEALSTAIGRKPLMTQNEGRARVNLPRSDEPGADSLEAPANIMGGNEQPAEKAEPIEPDEGSRQAAAAVIRAHWGRQAARLAKVPPDDQGSTFAAKLMRWNRELSDDLTPILGDRAEPIAAAVNLRTFTMLNAGQAAFTREVEVT